MLQLGQRIDKRYDVIEKLGQGGMGAVYRVRHVHLGCELALKELLSPGGEDQFLQEARILAGLHHPNLPRVTDFFSARGQHYLVMDYIPGDDLQARLDRQKRPFTEAEVLPWLHQLLEALAYVHAQGVVHRDVKPANMKLTPEGRLVLVDFGIAKGGAAAPGRTGFHAHGAYTPYLAAPEQVMGQGTGPRSDLYMVGASFTYLLTGTLPPQSGALSGPLGPVLARAMAPDAAGRWLDAASMRQALKNKPIPPSLPGSGLRWDIRR